MTKPEENPEISRSLNKANAEPSARKAPKSKAEMAEMAFKALKERPKLSIRMQIYFSFIFSFVVILGIATAHLVNIYKMESKIRFLESSNLFLFEVQQARRFEKNFFLYGTNLDDAMDNIRIANKMLLENREEWINVIGRDKYDQMVLNFARYDRMLQDLISLQSNKDKPEYAASIAEVEGEVRRYGHLILSIAQEVLAKEKAALERMLTTSRRIHIVSFLFLFLFIAFITYFLGRRILNPINRFLNYTHRIAAGDFTPIMPARRYRDEFSQLAIAINQMIKELDRRQDYLIESHKMRAVGTLTAGVAHELNNPINNITLTAHLMYEDYDQLSDEEKKDMIKDIINESDRSQRIVSNLLDFARESKSKMEPLDISDVTRETWNLAKNQVTLKGVRIELNVDDELPRIYGDKQQLCQVFLNLILNALDVTEKNGKILIDVSLSDDPKFISVKVTDFGSGIPDHILGSIFDPFFTTKERKKGTGLGLSVSQGIVAKHGGKINVKTKVGKGSTFEVLLPVTSFPADIRKKVVS